MEHDQTIWSHYQPGYVDPMFVPYLRTYIQDPWNNQISTNTWERQSLGPKSNGYRTGIVDPALFRLNWGQSFMNMFADDPCPPGFEKAAGGYCVKSSRDAEPIFYTDKAFVAKNQYFNGYADTTNQERRISEQTDLRSVNPLTGHYTVYYRPNPGNRNCTRYGKVPTKDSYL